MKNLLGIVVSYLFIALIIVSAKFFEKKGEESSRKYIHIMLSNWWILAMNFFTNWIWASIVPISFIIINWISYKKGLISVMEREKQDGPGTVYYAITLFILVIVTFGIIKRPEIGLVSALIMGYGDGFAAIIGKLVKSTEYKVGNATKTCAGSATMLFVSFVIISVFLVQLGVEAWYLKAIILSIIITLIEAVSKKGTDNLSVPLTTCGMLIILLNVI